jgi:hypothetical protein
VVIGMNLPVATALAGLAAAGLTSGCGRLAFDALAQDSSSTPLDASSAGDAPVSAGDAGAPPADAAVRWPSYVEVIGALATAPVLDGMLEPDLVPEFLTPRGWTGDSPVPAGQRAEYAVAYRPDALYLHVRVRDDSRLPAPSNEQTYCGDAVELYIDSNAAYGGGATPNHDADTRQFVVVAPATSDTPATRSAVFRNTANLGTWAGQFYMAPLPDGYALEALVQAGDLGLASWALTAGGRIGLDIGINVSQAQPGGTGCALRLGQYFLSVADLPGGDAHPYFNTAAFVNPQLVTAREPLP